MNWRTWVVGGVGLAFVLAALAQVRFVNGPAYWSWPWRSIGLARGIVFFGLPLLPFYYVTQRLESAFDPWRTRAFLALLSATMFCMVVMGILVDPAPGLLLRIVQSPAATSYYSDALEIDHPMSWLAGFHRATLALHSSTHPPGPILFYYGWTSLFGPEAGGLVGAWLIAALAALGVPVLHRFAALWTPDPGARMSACALYSMTPGLLLFFPVFDMVYPVLSMLLFISWVQAVQGKVSAVVAFGSTLFLCTLFAYNLLAAGAILLFFWAQQISVQRDAASWRRFAKAPALGLAVFVLLHVLFWLITGYQPIQSFRHAMATQGSLADGHARPYLSCLGFDLYDFALGGGILPAVLLGCFFLRRPEGTQEAGLTVRRTLATIGVLGILTVDLTGFLRCETARVWLFLQPWVLVPAALELKEWAPGPRQAVFCLQWFVVVVIKCSMTFMYA